MQRVMPTPRPENHRQVTGTGRLILNGGIMAGGRIEYRRKEYHAAGGVESAADGSQRFAAWLLDLPGCIAQGSSPSEAQERLEAIAPPFFAALEKIGAPIPEPTPLPAIIPGAVSFYDVVTGMPMGLNPGRQILNPQLDFQTSAA